MPKYKCDICKKVYVGWAVKHKHEGRCPVCGSELREISDNNKRVQRIEEQKEVSED
jgi:transcription initiation factor IIE alpha subunit